MVLYARFGYAARGVVYLLVGGLAALVVLDQGGETTGSQGALQSLLLAPAGDVLLVIIAVGLVGYAIWRCLQATLDTDAHGSGAKGLVIRAGLLMSAVTHALLAVFAVSLVFTFGQSGGGGQSLASWLMQQPFGQWLVGMAGAIFIAVGVAHIIKAVKGGFDRHFDMAERTKRWAYPICYLGLSTRGVVFMIVGVLFIMAAWHAAPGQAGGTSEVFNVLSHQVFGRWLLGIMATGLFAFGLYSLLLAAYRRIDPTPQD
ncbi:DUF1206 domain-containing protein [Marinobacter zhanjiangensis]|uniref:DUF1206 domain-containing protein n=1 Tax=Marinobacter zhanjiangensis TaxID=578215 RepID=A0ABQ3B7E2_9GAMM|nr:DUF1206 domain-containing protein [Marinobacter zhanjiangensis]GGY82743.1 hypothetical protein GCM10007071_32790 [Marinobacter zhanjiangensis]